jgi:thiol:disulfide interchange protein DsbD
MKKLMLGLALGLSLAPSVSLRAEETTNTKTEQVTKQNCECSTIQSVKAWFTALPQKIQSTDSLLLRLLFVFLLGLLMSMTPCIYPMIPITVGVIQSQGSKSLLQNFFLSFAYTIGLATTFSVMGLLAASSGEAFGHLMGSPFFVYFIVAVLAYFAFSMFGLYNLYIPSFMKGGKSISGSGSYLSIFLFGLASGTVSSPCLSPGLALVLTMVATMANKFLGLLLLFVFGIGISIPLLVIGTFSTSINLLPRAGMWMIEVQKLFGFLLLGMCFFYLNNILPWYVILVMLTIFSLCGGIFYLRSVSPSDSKIWRAIKNLLGIGGIAISVFLFVETFQELYYPELNAGVEAAWYTDYDKALEIAKDQNKNLFIDFWAPFCSICKAITKTVLKDDHVAKALEDFVVVQVDAGDADLEPYKSLQARYNIQGVPNLIIVDPHNGNELKRWRSEIYDEDNADVIEELKKYIR